MFLRIILILIVVAVVFFLIRFFVTNLNFNPCPSCDGKGYWESTRGEKNTCKQCGGTGKKQ
jgi:hypothetical protein